MGLFDFLRRGKDKPSQRSTMSRIEYLLDMYHDQLEAPKEAFDGENFLQLVEKQLDRGELYLATDNIASQVRLFFSLADLYWGQGDLVRAETYLNKTLERHKRLAEARAQHGLPQQSYYGIECAKCAACLLDAEVAEFAQIGAPELGYVPWFKDALLNYCISSRDFDMQVWQDGADEWTKRRFPKYRLEEFAVYIKALTGGYASTDEMLRAHQEMFAGRAKRNPESDLLDGYDDNELIIDFIFAAILKRIGWQGTYRHSWPNTDRAGSVAQTTKQPDRYLGVVAAQAPAPNTETGIIEDPQAARRFVDIHLEDQRDDEGKLCAANRPSKERGKVAEALKDLGWARDPATLDLMQTYRMDQIWNSGTHLFLCDPVHGSSISLGDWTKLLSEDFGLHADFVAIAGSEEKSDYRDPQGAWYVFWKKDRKIYAVERDEWDRPDAATANARLGINHWPSYTSFVAWWVSENLKAHASRAHDTSS